MSTVITVTVQKFGKDGDGLVPVLNITDQHKFDTDAQAEAYHKSLMEWLDERPIPDIDIHPFPSPRNKFDPHQLDVIIEDMLVPETVHLNGD